jgi:hypothetical protein
MTRRRVRRSAPLGALLFFAALLAGTQALAIDMAAGGGPVSVPVTSLQAARFKTTLRQQYDFSCGSAALASLLTYQYGVQTSEAATFEFMFAHGDQDKIRREGFSMLDMKGYLDALGFDADGYEAPLEKLAQTQVPAIVLINDGGYHHFVVVKGLNAGRVLLGDPSRGTRLMAREDFDAVWIDHLLFVIHAQHRRDPRVAAFNAADDWSRAPLAPLGNGIDRSGLDSATMLLMGPGDF